MLLAAAKIFCFFQKGLMCIIFIYLFIFKSNVHGLQEMETLKEKQRKNILASFSTEPVKVNVSGWSLLSSGAVGFICFGPKGKTFHFKTFYSTVFLWSLPGFFFTLHWVGEWKCCNPSHHLLAILNKCINTFKRCNVTQDKNQPIRWQQLTASGQDGLRFELSLKK